MKTAVILVGVMLFASPAHAVQVDLSFGAPPPLIDAEPGVQVVPDLDEEVFYADGAYWYRDGDVWYRSYDWRGGWEPVSYVYVPQRIVVIPYGHYRHWHPSYWRGSAPVVVHRGYYRNAPPRAFVNAPPRTIVHSAPHRVGPPPRPARMSGPRHGNGPHHR